MKHRFEFHIFFVCATILSAIIKIIKWVTRLHSPFTLPCVNYFIKVWEVLMTEKSLATEIEMGRGGKESPTWKVRHTWVHSWKVHQTSKILTPLTLSLEYLHSLHECPKWSASFHMFVFTLDTDKLHSTPYESHLKTPKELLMSKRRKMQWNCNR